MREKYLLKQKEEVELEATKAQLLLEDGRKDTDSLREEMETMMTVTNKYWDTSRITGGPQRFLTESVPFSQPFLSICLFLLHTLVLCLLSLLFYKTCLFSPIFMHFVNLSLYVVYRYLKVRLAEQLSEMEAKVSEDSDVFNDFVVRARKVERELRQVRRELQPLTQGMAIKTRRDRVVRIRNKVRLEKRSSTAIQRYFRGYRLRKALFSWYRDYWIEKVDETTGGNIYYNTWSEEVKWTRPLEMILLPHLAKEAPDEEQLAILNRGIGKGGDEENDGDGSVLSLEEDDEEEDESDDDTDDDVEDDVEWAIEGQEEQALEVVEEGYYE